MAQEYDIGDRPVYVVTFADENGVLTEMSAITFRIKDPAGTIVEAAIGDATSPSTGVYEWQIPAAFDQHGRWVLGAQGTAPIEAAIEDVVRVKNSAFD